MNYIVRHIDVKNKNRLQRIALVIKHYVRYPYSEVACKSDNRIMYYVKDIYQQIPASFKRNRLNPNSLWGSKELREFLDSSSNSKLSNS